MWRDQVNRPKDQFKNHFKQKKILSRFINLFLFYFGFQKFSKYILKVINIFKKIFVIILNPNNMHSSMFLFK